MEAEFNDWCKTMGLFPSALNFAIWKAGVEVGLKRQRAPDTSSKRFDGFVQATMANLLYKSVVTDLDKEQLNTLVKCTIAFSAAVMIGVDEAVKNDARLGDSPSSIEKA